MAGRCLLNNATFEQALKQTAMLFLWTLANFTAYCKIGDSFQITQPNFIKLAERTMQQKNNLKH